MDLETLDTLIRGAGIGLAGFLCVHQLTVIRKVHGATRGILFGMGAAGYLTCSAPWFNGLPEPLYFPILTLCMFNPLLYWLFARAVFADVTRINKLEWSISACFSLLVLARVTISQTEWYDLTAVLLQVAGLGMVLHILFIVASGFSSDLLETRRKSRVIVVLTTGLYMLLIAIAELTLAGKTPPDSVAVLNAVGIFFLIAGIALTITSLNREFYPALAVRGEQPLKLKGPDAELMEKAVAAMASGIYTDENLTLAVFSGTLGVPEYQLRRAINQGLGYRNFNSFVNEYRLKQVSLALADPKKARLPILTLALSAGFSSISPFNRAFKAEFGTTPSLYRARYSAQSLKNT